MASTKLTKSYSTTGNRRTHTVSFWVKFCNTTTANTILNIGPFGGDQEYRLTRNASGTLEFYDYGSGSYRFRYRTHRLFRDVNAWYHIICAVDTTQAGAADRVKIYVNGVQETSFDVGTHPSQNFDTAWGIANNYTLAATESGNFLDGVLSHFHYTDGTAYDATAFGETDATTGEWKINTSPSVTYGTNGFFILKDGNSVTDQSGNSNNWTVSGTLTKTEDNPSNVFATLNPLIYQSRNNTFSNGNLKITGGTADGWDNKYGVSTIAVSSGKWYVEAKATTMVTSHGVLGIISTSSSLGGSLRDSGVANIDSGGRISGNGGDFETGLTSFASGDIAGMAFDADAGTVQFYRNGSTYGSQVTSIASDTYYFATNSYEQGAVMEFNFGNGYFGTTAVASAGTNASGNGIFEYDCPDDYTALSTKGLNL